MNYLIAKESFNESTLCDLISKTLKSYYNDNPSAPNRLNCEVCAGPGAYHNILDFNRDYYSVRQNAEFVLGYPLKYLHSTLAFNELSIRVIA